MWSCWRGIAAQSLVLLMMSGAASAERVPVNIELLLALDASASMDAKEFDLQMQGIALAFRNPDVLQAVENLKPLGVAVGVLQWGGPGESRMLIPFTHLEGATDAKAFGFLVGRGYRFIGATSTSIVTAIEDGVAALDNNGFEGQRVVIDISGDGKDNSGLSIDNAKKLARSRGVTINGLAIEADEGGSLTVYYRDTVISGPEAFVETATDFDDFARAIAAKLVRELRPLGS
jgi:hypothetical protein